MEGQLFNACPASKLCSNDTDDGGFWTDIDDDDFWTDLYDGFRTDYDDDGSTSPSECIGQAFACFFDEECLGCMDQATDDDTQIDDDDSLFEDNSTGCDEAWDTMCFVFGGLSANCIDNERLFDLIRECSYCAVASVCLGRKLSDVYLDYCSIPK